MFVKFKEKTYEKFFAIEVGRHTRRTFSPDQYDESFLGFDDAFHLRFDLLYSYGIVRRRRRSKRIQDGITISEIDDSLAKIASHFPRFRFNLFIQYKRPEYVKSPNAAEWTSWRKPYYRFDLTEHQQRLLERIAHRAANRAAVIYASPAFWRDEDLFEFAEAETVIQRSNIAHARLLAGHERYTYTDPGSKGRAYSDPEDVSGPTFSEILQASLASEALTFARHIKQAAQMVIDASREDSMTFSLLSHARLALGLREFTENSLADALVTLEAFSDAFHTSYIAIG